MTLTEQIYSELVDGLDKGVDWEQFLSKYRTSKGPLYNAVGMVLQDIMVQVADLDEEKRKTQEEVNLGGLRLDSLNQKIREAESAIEAKTHELSEAEEKRSSVEKQIESLKSKRDEENEFINRVGEIEKLALIRE